MKFTRKEITTIEVFIPLPAFFKEKGNRGLTECVALFSEVESITIRHNESFGTLFYSIMFNNYEASSFKPENYDYIAEDEFWKEYEKVEKGLSENVNIHRPLSV